MAFLLFTLLLAVLAGFAAHYLARRKRRAAQPWVWASVLFLFPVAILALLPARGTPHPA